MKAEDIKLINYSKKAHLKYLQKWLTNEDLMRGWGMRPFWKDKVAEWVEENNRVVLMVNDVNLDKIVGFVNFYDWDRDKRIASRGTLIDLKYQNKGYGTAAILASNKHAFIKLGIKKIELYIDEDNVTSRHITEKLGYKFSHFDPKKKRRWYFMEK